MDRSNAEEWVAVYDREQRARKKGRDDLAWLGLVAQEDDETRQGFTTFDRNAEFVGTRSSRSRERGTSLSKPVDSATRLALLVWAGMIASLAVLLG